MATFQAQIVDLVGTIYEDTAAMSQFLTDGVRQLVNVLPLNRLDDIMTVHPLNDNDGATFSLNDSNHVSYCSVFLFRLYIIYKQIINKTSKIISTIIFCP